MGRKKLDIKNYPGSKGGSGVTEWIINHVPKFDLGIDAFAGSGTIGFELMKGQDSKVLINEKSVQVYNQLKEVFNAKKRGNGCSLINSDFFEIDIDLICKMIDSNMRVFIYFDPPYLFDTRRSQKAIYEHEWTIKDHIRFFEVVKILIQKGALIMISHYDCRVMREALPNFYTSEIQAMTRGGVSTEKIWMNYDINDHDLAISKYIGKDFIDRQRIKRMQSNLIRKINNLPRHERQAMLEYIQKHLYVPEINTHS